ncbi:glycerophosphodiester phosphodiesterase family protein [Paenibacillus gallinarum]|nr:glycerophosphodiester phosphodiesterase family protein [Paenibacillus gallinarum]
MKIASGQFESIFENYLQAQNYADRALGGFLDKLEEDGILDKSIIVVYGDHFAPGLHADDMYKLLGKDTKPNVYESSELFKVPFIVRLPKGEDAGVIDNTGGQMDLYPTLINLLGLNKKETFYLGHDLLNAKSYAAFRTHIPSGSVVNNEYFYLSMGDGVFENGTCYDRKTGSAVEVNLCIAPYREAKNSIKISDYILNQDNLEEIIDHKPGVENAETEDMLFANTPNAWADHYTLIAHALGAIDGYSHTNSIDALITSYDNGHRVFEMDLITTSDGVLIGRHDWYEDLYGKLYQEVSKDKFNKPLSLDEFLSLPINKKYTPMTAEQMLVILSQYPDMYIVTDTKTANSEEVKKQFSQLVASARSVDPSVLDRIIPQIYTENMHKAVDEIHPFTNYIYSLYINDYDDDRVLQYAKDNKLGVVMMDENRYSKAFVDRLAKAGIKTYMHTFNDVDKVKDYQKQGVIGVMTDQLIPSDIK